MTDARAQLRARLLTLIPYFDIGDKPTTLQGQPIADDYRLLFNRTAEALREAVSILGEPETPAPEFTPEELTTLRAEFETWLNARNVSPEVRAMLLPWKPVDSPVSGGTEK